MNIISLIIKKIWIFALFIIISLLIFTMFLIKGIKIDSLESNLFILEGLYIKLDKKLILEIDKLEIHKQKNTKSSSDEIINLANRAKYIEFFFKKIDITNLSYDNFNAKILYTDDNFFIDTTYLTLDAQFAPYENGVNLEVKKLFLKDYNTHIIGNIDADFRREIYYFSGEFSGFGLNGNLNLILDNDILTYKINSVKTQNLSLIKNELLKLKLDQEIANWIYGYTKADEYFLENLSGKFDFKTKNFFPKEIRANGYVSNANIKFNKNLKPVLAKKIDIELKNENLIFYPKNTDFDNNKAISDGVKIYNIFSKNIGILINIKSKTLYTKSINNILKAYKINLNLEQKSGLMDANFNLKIDFNPFKLDYNGEFIVQKSKINLFGADFYTNFAKIILNNNILKIENSNLNSDIFNINGNGVIELDKSIGNFNAILDLKIDQILQLKDYKVIANLDFNKNVTLKLDNDVDIIFSNSTIIQANNLSKFIQNSKLMQNLKVKNANMLLKTDNFKDFDIEINDAIFESNFLKKDGTYYTNDDFIVKHNDDTTIQTKSGFLKIKRFKNGDIDAKIENLDIELDTNSNEKNDFSIIYQAKNSNIKLKDQNRVLKFSSYKGKINNKIMTLNAKTLKNGSVDIYKDEHTMGLSGENLDSNFINEIANHKAFKDGEFSILLNGKSFDDFKGEFIIQNSHIIDLAGYHQLLSFINSIPSLLIFTNPDFNEKGFTVKNGVIRFTKKHNILNFKAMNLDGSSADIIGKGTVNLDNKNIDFDLELRLLKAASNILGKIPLVNQILLGSDRTISTIIKGKGTLENPEFNTEILQDTLKTPYNIVKNILELPFNLFN